MLLGNSADFDAIRARYQSLSYPTPEQAAFNATRASYEGLLTGSGYNTMMTPTSTPGQQVSFSVDPNTGQVTTNIPQYDIPTFENIYQTDEGLIGPDGRPREASPVMGQPLPVVPQRGSGGDGFERLQKFKADQARNELRKQISNNKFFDLPDLYEPKLPGYLGFFEGLLGNIPRDMAINKIMQDIDKSQTFDQAIADSAYQGSSAMEKDRSPEDRETFGPAETKPQGPSFDDAATGKFSGTGGKNGKGQKGTGGFKAGQGPTGGMGGAVSGTARF